MTSKLLYFASDYKIGLSFTLADQAKSLNKIFGDKFICIAGENEQVKGLESQYLNNDISILRIKGLDKHENFFSLCYEINKILVDNEIEIVHVHNNWQLALSAYVRLRYRKKIKIIYSIHGYRHNHRIKSIFAKRIIGLALLFLADIIFAGSSELKNAIPFIRRKCYLLFQGVDEQIVNLTSKSTFDGKLKIAIVGQFRHGKNQDVIINAFSEYAQKTNDFNFTLHFAGTGEKLKEIKLIAQKSIIASNIKFLGQLNRSEIYKLYEEMDIAVVATNFETFGFCIAEPFVAEIPLFSRNTGIAKDIIVHGENGFVFQRDEELVSLLIQYLRDVSQLKRISNRLKTDKHKLLWDNIMPQYLEIINRI
jgi:glycosyltransferase involved in cell wall biosynthesis